jgi:phenylalanyl-tRNA synthetase alpha chain
MAYTVPKLKDFSPAALDKAVEKLLSALEKESASLKNDSDKKAFRDRWLARKDGILTQVNELWLKAAPKEAKRDVGQRVNKLKAEVEQKIEVTLAQKPGTKVESSLDISLPGIRRPVGAEHPIIRTQNEIVGVFKNLGYSVAEGPVIETDLQL